jgi:hypothetical protein
MVLKIISLMSLFFFANTASAFDAGECPYEFAMTAKVVRVFKSSIYSKTAGWKEAQETLMATLMATQELKTKFFMTEVDATACTYEDANGHIATLATASFRDPSERKPVLVNQLIVNLKIEGSSYFSFLPIESYSKDGLKTSNRPYSLKIKARLYDPPTQRFVSLDLGMISIALD